MPVGAGPIGTKTDWYRDAGRSVEETLGTSAAAAARIRKVTLAAVVATIAAFAFAGCGESGERQDANTPDGQWKVAVEKWEFPKRQPLGRPVTMKIVVRNIDTEEIPSVVFTIGGIREPVKQQDSATRTRPVWIINETRGGDQTPYNSLTKSSYKTGPLASGDVRTFELPLTPLRRGEHVVSYTLNASLFKGGQLKTVDGDPAAGSRTIAIDPTPDFDESVFD